METREAYVFVSPAGGGRGWSAEPVSNADDFSPINSTSQS